MSYKKGMLTVRRHNSYHIEWLHKDGTWARRFDYDTLVKPTETRRIEHPEPEHIFEAELPHSCDSWVIGDSESLAALAHDLGRAAQALASRREMK